MTELKQCPNVLCNSTNVVLKKSFGWEETYKYWIECRECGLIYKLNKSKVNIKTHVDAANEIIRQWNTREVHDEIAATEKTEDRQRGVHLL